MKEAFDRNDIFVEYHPSDGFTLSTINNCNERVHFRYIGYDLEEAKDDFIERFGL